MNTDTTSFTTLERKTNLTYKMTKTKGKHPKNRQNKLTLVFDENKRRYVARTTADTASVFPSPTPPLHNLTLPPPNLTFQGVPDRLPQEEAAEEETSAGEAAAAAEGGEEAAESRGEGNVQEAAGVASAHTRSR